MTGLGCALSRSRHSQPEAVRLQKFRKADKQENRPVPKKDAWILQLDNREHYSKYALDDLWVVSSQPNFTQKCVFDTGIR